MKRLHIGGQSVLTGDDLADALLDFALALYESGRVESVALPIVDEGGEPQQARLLLTPALAMWATTVPDGEKEPTDPGLVRMLEERARQLGGASVESGYGPRDEFDPFGS